MRAVRPLVVTALALVVLAVPAVVLADGRVALVVGNSTYAHIGRLPNPDNDARDISAALRRLGFEVTTELDADRVELTEALRAFTRQSAGANVSLVFYAGHGIEMDGVNYLVPVDARLERDVDVRFETVTVDDLLVSTSGASLRLVVLDACRNNPLARSIPRHAAADPAGSRCGRLRRGRCGRPVRPAYAGGDSELASARGVRSTGYLDSPQVEALPGRGRSETPPSAGVTAGASEGMEVVFWQSIVNSTNPADFEAYLEQFPNGVFRALAQNRLVALRSSAGGAPAATGSRAGGVGSPPSGARASRAPASASGAVTTADSRRPSAVMFSPDRTCAGQPAGAACWMEIALQPGVLRVESGTRAGCDRDLDGRMHGWLGSGNGNVHLGLGRESADRDRAPSGW